MKDKVVLTHFRDVAERLSCRVIFDKFDGKGGHCIVKGTQYIIINKRLPRVEQVEVFSEALKRLPIDTVYILPRIRKYIETD